MREHPGEHDLICARAEFLRDASHRLGSSHPVGAEILGSELLVRARVGASQERGVGQQWKVVRGAEVEHFLTRRELRIETRTGSRTQVAEALLNADVGCERLRLLYVERLHKAPRGVVTRPEVADLSGRDEPVKRLETLFERRRTVVLVRVVEINVLDSHAREALVALLDNLLRRQPALDARILEPHLARNDEVIPVFPVGHPAAEQRLAFASFTAVEEAGVNIRGIEEVPAAGCVGVENVVRGRFVLLASKEHRSEAELRNAQVTFSKVYLFHRPYRTLGIAKLTARGDGPTLDRQGFSRNSNFRLIGTRLTFLRFSAPPAGLRRGSMNDQVEDSYGFLEGEGLVEAPETFRASARIADDAIYREAAKDPVAWWEDRAKHIEWFKRWNKAMKWDPPHVQWFAGGELNMSYNCLDRHLDGPRRNKAAIVWESEDGRVRTWTYKQLHREVSRFANAMRTLGIGRGDRVAIYMPMVVESAVAMLACSRIGAIHNVVFGGFSPDSLAERINDSTAKALITADGGSRRGTVLQLKQECDKALENCPTIEHVIVVENLPGEQYRPRMHAGRDHWYHDLVGDASDVCEPERMDAEDPLFILYTSGTTGKPKGIVHTTGGYAVGTQTTSELVFDMQERDLFWCSADVGWITGHSYVVYGPLLCGATILMYEGAPDYPEKDRFWDIIERHGVTIFYTAPTAIRAFMKWGRALPQNHDLSSLRLLGSVGEPINPEAWQWYHAHIGGGRCPIVDTWWQTETGAIMISGLPGVSTMKPGFAGTPLPGIEATVLDENGEEVTEGSGFLAILHPWPSIARTIWGDDERYTSTYFSKWDAKTYFPGDGARRDSDGRFLILGRVDDVLNVSGHRIGTMEVESALVDHEAVAEAAVVGKKHELKGQAVVAFVTLKARFKATVELREELRSHVGLKIGSLAKPEDVIFSSDLPKTRSGKIMRRLLRDIAEGKALGDVTTLADPAVVEQLRESYEEAYGG